MKKAKYIMLGICAIFFALILGTFIGRNVNHMYEIPDLVRISDEGNVLHFAGANTMEDILKYVSAERFYPRILKVESSLEKCEKLNIDPSHIIPMKGAASLEENIDLIERYDASAIIT